MFRSFFALSFIVLSLVSPAEAGFKGSISFSDAEKANHLVNLDKLLQTSAQCLESSYAFHMDFFKKWGISPFYGDQSEYGVLPYSQQKQYLKNRGLPASLADEMIPISCVGFAIRCLKQGFESVGQKAYWDKIMAFTRKNDVDGTALQSGLRELGWRILYWNPVPALNAQWDAEERRDYPNDHGLWGYHAERYSSVMNSGTYYYSKVDDATTLVNFGTNVPASFQRAPFFVGSAHAGYHVFPGTFGRVYEGHGSRDLGDQDTIQTGEFNPYAENGSPYGGYRTGIVAVPPGY